MDQGHTAEHSAATSPAVSCKQLIGAVIMLGLIGAFLLLRAHWSRIGGYWLYLLLLACPLMHLFHSHGGRGSHEGDSSKK